MRVLTATLLLTLALGGTALAGGWAVTTLDTLPAEIHAGQTYAIGWTIRQHGQTPVNVASLGGTTEIVATAPKGSTTVSFPGKQDGPTGHYVGNVTFPTDGAWTWKVTQGPFEAQSLGSIVVLAAGATGANAKGAAPVATVAPVQAAARPASQPSGANAWLLIALLLASSGAAVLFGSRLATLTRRAARA